jgi:competence protein ComGC
MNTISTVQNKIDLYTQKSEKIAKTLEITKAEERKKEILEDSIQISQQALQSSGNTFQVTANRINPLDDLVSAGTITQEQATAVESAFQSVGKAIQSSGIYNNRPKNPLDALITTDTITAEQEAAIKSAFESSIKPTKAPSKNQVTTALDSLVTSGTIAQTQEDLIIEALAESMNTNRPNFDKSNDTVTNPLDTLVSTGTITQDQEDAIQSAFESAI